MHHFGKFCPRSYQKSFLNEMFKMLTLSPHLTFVHRSSAFSTAEMEMGNWFSNLHHPDTNSCLILLLLTCANLAFLMMYYDWSFVKPGFPLGILRPTCDGRPFAASPSGESRPPFSMFLCVVASAVCDLSGSMPDPSHTTQCLVQGNVLKT